MQRALIQAPWHRASAVFDGHDGCALTAVSLDHHTAERLFVDPQGGGAVAIDGELYEASRADATSVAAAIWQGYSSGGAGFLRTLRGSFAAAIWDAKQQRLVLLTDRFGSRPLYYRHAGDTLRFGSTLAGVLAGDPGPRRVNPRGLAQFFTFGHYLRDDTSLADVRVVPAAARVEFSPGSGELKVSTYWSLREAGAVPTLRVDEALDRIEEAFTTAVRRTAGQATGLGISLSGGLDARAILGVVDTQQTPLEAVCLGVKGSLDHRSSGELARIAGVPFHPYVLDASFLGNFRQHLARMVELTDGQYLSQCIVIPTLSIYRELGIRTLLRGHAGELMHMRKAYNYSLDDEALAINSDAKLREWLFRRLRAYMLDGVQTPLFKPAFQAGLEPLAAESLDQDLADVAHVASPLARIWHLFVGQRLRRETVLSMLKFRSVVEPRLPYLDNDLIPWLLSAPPELKLGEEIQSHILRKRRPEFLRVTNANTGAVMGAGRWRQRLATLQMKVLAKAGVPGYQPYERLGLWLRRDLAADVRSILLDEETLENGVYSADGVRAVVRGHLEEGKNHTFLLMALMIFQLGLKRLAAGNLPGETNFHVVPAMATA